MAQTKQQRLAGVYNEARSQFNCIQSSVREVRQQCLEDRRFVSVPGAMYEGWLGKQFKNKPQIEINKIMRSLIRIYNDYRNNRITVDFTNKDGSEKDDLASVCDGLFRADAQDSNAEDATDNAFEEGTAGGLAAWRLISEYEDEYNDEDDYQRIRFEPIYDADSCVFFDLDAKKQDKSDAKCCFVLSSTTVEAFKEEWGEDPASWPKEIESNEFDWTDGPTVYVAEYYKVEEKSETIYIFTSLTDEEIRHTAKSLEDAGGEDELLIQGITLEKTKRVKARKVHKYIMSGARILEDCGFIAGKCIPIIPFYGKRWYIDNIERCQGHVRLAKDPTRLQNMQVSKLAEIAGSSATEKPILTPQQVLGNEKYWSEDNIKNYAYLLINPTLDRQGNEVPITALNYTRSPNIPPALGAIMQIGSNDLREILGNEGGDEIVSNISGEAIEQIQTRLDMQSFMYISNMAKSFKRCGEVWLSMARELYVDEGRKMKSIGVKNDTSSIELGQVFEGEEGEVVKRNDLTEASFDVNVSVGPSSESKHSALNKQLLAMKQFTTDPETIQVIDALLMMNLEGEGVEETKKFWRNKLLRMGAVEPTQEEQKAIDEAADNAEPDPNAEFLQAEADKATALADKALADTEQSRAKTEKTKAETVEIMADVDLKDQEVFENKMNLLEGTAGPTSETDGGENVT